MEQAKSSRNHSRKSLLYLRLLGTAFALLLLGFSFMNLISPAKAISEKEKRVLKTFPAPRWDQILEGAYSRDFEEYASDQILFRDFFTDLKVFSDTLLGKSESQGVYRGKDGFLLEKMETPDPSVYGESLETINAFGKQQEIPQFFVLVPNAVSVYADKLPLGAPSFDQSTFAGLIRQGLDKEVGFLSLEEPLRAARSEGDLLFYRSDHHWTSLGAYRCAPSVLALLGKDWQEGLLSSDPYTVFLGGNEGFIRIETDKIGAGHLLVFKDSYFNCFLPFLLNAYESIDVVDPRYYSEELSTLLYQKEYDQILYFYNCNTFSGDSSLSLVLGETLRP
ncbi:MAG: hypothetical protein J6H18_00320 [Lachnospiraceae bacterium]|nr:hypothetical protein [Lachnospiraceae bacterium]